MRQKDKMVKICVKFQSYFQRGTPSPKVMEFPKTLPFILIEGTVKLNTYQLCVNFIFFTENTRGRLSPHSMGLRQR
jgi:hypothetical protein